jgi:long-subunit acyl-CoA synthetase (AMP-forming)
MTMSDVDQGPSDDELFNEAVSDETPDAPVVSEQVEQPVRDEAGRFAKKEEPEAAEVVAEVQAEKPVVDDNASQVPSWRVREINEEKRAALAELETLRAERAQWQQRQQQPKAEPAPRPKRRILCLILKATRTLFARNSERSD